MHLKTNAVGNHLLKTTTPHLSNTCGTTCYLLIDCASSAVIYSTSDLSAYVGRVIERREDGLFYTVTISPGDCIDPVSVIVDSDQASCPGGGVGVCTLCSTGTARAALSVDFDTADLLDRNCTDCTDLGVRILPNDPLSDCVWTETEAFCFSVSRFAGVVKVGSDYYLYVQSVQVNYGIEWRSASLGTSPPDCSSFSAVPTFLFSTFDPFSSLKCFVGSVSSAGPTVTTV